VDNDATFSSEVVVDDGEARVVLGGEIDLTSVPEFFARIQEADRVNTGKVIVMMHHVSLIDSSGLGVLARLAAGGVTIEIRGAKGVVRRALEISGLDQAANIRVV
jgi:anti-anti-sigma factor